MIIVWFLFCTYIYHQDAAQPADHATPKILVAHNQFRATLAGAAWAIIPVLEEIYRAVNVGDGMETMSIRTKWLILCEEQTQVNLTSLMANLKAESYQKVYIQIIHTNVMMREGWMGGEFAYFKPYLTYFMFRLNESNFSFGFSHIKYANANK
jgi:hypothetical protein